VTKNSGQFHRTPFRQINGVVMNNSCRKTPAVCLVKRSDRNSNIYVRRQIAWYFVDHTHLPC